MPLKAPSTSPATLIAARHLIHFAGRAGDRNARAMPGSAVLAAGLAEKLGIETTRVGHPAPPIAAEWQIELEAALPALLELRGAIRAALVDGPSIAILNRCAASLATLPAVAAARQDAVIVWFDAHGDCNLPELTTSGYLGGLVISAAAGLWDSGLGAGIDLAKVILVGARDLDPFEQELVDNAQLTLVAPGPALARRLRAVVATRPVYVHLDCDVLEPGLVPSEFQVPGGLTLSDLREAAAVLAESELVGIEVAEFEAEWPDGTIGDPTPLIEALSPLLPRW